jgi:hypothetical protein
MTEATSGDLKSCHVRRASQAGPTGPSASGTTRDNPRCQGHSTAGRPRGRIWQRPVPPHRAGERTRLGSGTKGTHPPHHQGRPTRSLGQSSVHQGGGTGPHLARCERVPHCAPPPSRRSAVPQQLARSSGRQSSRSCREFRWPGFRGGRWPWGRRDLGHLVVQADQLAGLAFICRQRDVSRGSWCISTGRRAAAFARVRTNVAVRSPACGAATASVPPCPASVRSLRLICRFGDGAGLTELLKRPRRL